MAKENIFSKIEVTMKGGGKMTWCMEKANCFSPMANFSIKENGHLMNRMAGEFYRLTKKLINLNYGKDMKERWKMEKCMVEANCTSMMVLFLRASSKMEKYLVEDAEPILKGRWFRNNGGWWGYRHFWEKRIVAVPDYLSDWVQMQENSDDTYFIEKISTPFYLFKDSMVN